MLREGVFWNLLLPSLTFYETAGAPRDRKNNGDAGGGRGERRGCGYGTGLRKALWCCHRAPAAPP